jgi:hypothetical protein
MTTDEKYAVAAIKRMMDYTEENSIEVLGIVLMTELSSGVEVVRKIVCSLDPEAAKFIATATDVHFSAFVLPKGAPDDRSLMELH